MRVQYTLFAFACVMMAVAGGCNTRRVNPVEASRTFDRATSDNDRLLVRSSPVEQPVAIIDEPSAVRVAAGLRPGDPYTAEYNPSTVITIRGPVVGMRRIPLAGDRTGLFVEVKNGGEITEVYLGPESWLNDHLFAPEITGMMTATGAQLRTNNGRMIIAREAGLRGVTLQIRDQDGTPLFPVPVEDSTL